MVSTVNAGQSSIKRKIKLAMMLGTASFIFIGGSLVSTAQAQSANAPPLVITNEPLPNDLRNKVYSKPSQVRNITPAEVTGANYFGDGSETVVGKKVLDLRNELFSLQEEVAKSSEKLSELQVLGQRQAATYYASVATISTQLQSGTTPGNPRLLKKLATARENLEKLSANIAGLNEQAVEVSNLASMSSFILETARATYSLTGAIEEDHVRLAQLEDAVNSTVVVIDRLLNNVNDDISRTVTYLAAERENLRVLSLAITTGDLFGKSLSNRPFSQAQQASFQPSAISGAGTFIEPRAQQAAPLAEPRPLVKIRFDRPDVSYEQPVYMAVNEALARYPDARFELIAVHPSQGNAAEVAIESTRARRNAEKVLRSLTQMGLDTSRVNLSYTPSPDASTNEVHLFVQ